MGAVAKSSLVEVGGWRAVEIPHVSGGVATDHEGVSLGAEGGTCYLW